MGKTMNLGKVAMTTAGEYKPSKKYDRLVAVTYEGESWVSRKDVPVGVAPGTDDEYWQLLAAKGSQGPQGERGPQGNSVYEGSGKEIVNNLTDGGEDKILSAEQGKILKNMPKNFTWIAGDVNQISYPNIDSKTGIMSMDGSIVVDGKAYEVKGKTFSLKNGLTTSEIKVVFNTTTKEFQAKAWDYELLNTEIVIGGCRLNYGTTWSRYDILNFPFLFTVDGVLYNDITFSKYGENVGYHHASFYVKTGTAHSSDDNRVKCDIPQGSLFYVHYKAKGEVTYVYPNVTYDDGTTEQFAVPTERYFVASKNIKEIGYYIPDSSVVDGGHIDVFVEYGKTLALTTQESFMKADGYDVRYIWMKSGEAHSSTKDQFVVSVKKGDSFNLKMVNVSGNLVKFGVGVQYVGDDTTTIISAGLPVDKMHNFIAQDDIEAIGIYIEVGYFSETGVAAAFLSMGGALQDALITNNAFTGVYSDENIQDATIRYAEKLTEVTGQAENFIFFTDPHLVGSNNQFPESSFKKQIGVLQKYYNSAPIDHVICGGDWLQAGDKKPYAMWKLGMIDATMNKLFKGYLPLLGNHDTNYQGYVSETDKSRGDLSQEQITNVMFRKFGKPYYSYQARASKFIMLDTQIDWESGMTSYKWEQIDWYGNLLLNNTDDNIIVFMHIYYNDGDIVNAMAQNVCNMAVAFNTRTSITLNGKTYNFGGAKGSIRCIVAGHSHYDEVTLNTDIPVVLTTTFNSDKGATFDMCSADFEKGKLYMTRVGEGADRVVALYK